MTMTIAYDHHNASVSIKPVSVPDWAVTGRIVFSDNYGTDVYVCFAGKWEIYDLVDGIEMFRGYASGGLVDQLNSMLETARSFQL